MIPLYHASRTPSIYSKGSLVPDLSRQGRPRPLSRKLNNPVSILNQPHESGQTTEENSDDRIANLYGAIYKLNPVEKALVTLLLEDFTYEQIAEATGITANHVGVMLHRARKKLSCLMEEPPNG